MTSSIQERTSWTAAGSDTAAKITYASIRKALEDLEQRRSVEVFLQGSYANATNVRADSDVDVVVMTRLTFQGSRDRLGPAAQARFDALPPASYTAMDLRTDVTDALVSYYGSARVHQRNKCIKVEGRDGYVDADVVPSLEYRWYQSPEADVTADYIEGIAINPLHGSRIINFPKEHISNGQRKNAECCTRFKESVRQIKRLRNRAVAEGRLGDGVAPGYLLECMTYNVPPDEFVADDSKRLSNVVLWLKYADKSRFLSCDGIHELFRDDPGQFDVSTSQVIVDALWDTY